MKVQEYKQYVLQGGLLSKDQALEISQGDLKELCQAADEIRKHFCGDSFDLCTIINGKSGRCSEDCKFCAQSAYYQTNVETYPLLSTDKVLEQAKYNENRGVLRYSIVTSGKRLKNEEIAQICETVKEIRKHSDISVCGSFGLLKEEQYASLKQAGITRVHNNLETSRNYFPKVCTTHSYEEKIEAIKAARKAGLSVCSGGIMGLGETMEDRIDMVIDIRRLGVRSIPVNMLNTIPGTPFESRERLTNEEMCRIVAVFRFLVPDASIRLAGGRGLLPDKGRACFQSGANAAISGDMLTTQGITIESDGKLIQELGYKPQLWK